MALRQASQPASQPALGRWVSWEALWRGNCGVEDVDGVSFCPWRVPGSCALNDDAGGNGVQHSGEAPYCVYT